MRYRSVADICMVILFLAVPLAGMGMEKNGPGKKEAAVITNVKASEKGDFATPDFELPDTNNDMVKLGDYKGRQPVLLFFWTTWCPFCRKELNMLNTKYASLAKDNVVVLAVNIGESPAALNAFLKSYQLVFRMLLDKDSVAATNFNLVGVPTYILVNKEGAIVFQDNFFPSAYKNLVSK